VNQQLTVGPSAAGHGTIRFDAPHARVHAASRGAAARRPQQIAVNVQNVPTPGPPQNPLAIQLELQSGEAWGSVPSTPRWMCWSRFSSARWELEWQRGLQPLTHSTVGRPGDPHLSPAGAGAVRRSADPSRDLPGAAAQAANSRSAAVN